MIEKQFGKFLIQYPKKDEGQLSLSSCLASVFSEISFSSTILDIGTGIGLSAMTLATNLPGSRVIGIDMRREYVRLAAQNVYTNGLRDSVEVFLAHFAAPPPRLAAGTFSLAISLIPSKQELEALNGSINLWIRFCLLMMESLGTIVFLCPAEHLQSFFIASHVKLGSITITPLWTADKRASWLLIKGIKGGQEGVTLEAGRTFP